MSRLDRAKILAEISKLLTEVWALVKDKRREDREQVTNERISKLEKEIEELKKKLG